MRDQDAAVEDFDSFVRRTYQGLLAKARLACRHQQDAEDAVQDAYLTVFKEWHRVGRYESPEAGLHTILRHTLWTQARKRTKQREVTEVFPAPLYVTPEETAQARDVLDALAGLPPKQRTALVMHCLYGMPQKELARELGVKRAAVAVNVHNARHRLERVLELGHGRREKAADGFHELAARTASRADPLTAALRVTERWLRESAQDSAALERISKAISSKFSEATGQASQ